MKTSIIIAMMSVLMIAAAAGDLCIVRGSVMMPDGSPSPSGTSVQVTNHNYDLTISLETGTDWPYPNFYLQALRCNPGDLMTVAATSGTASGRVDFTIEQNVNEMMINLIAGAEPPPSGGGGGGGGGSGTIVRPKPNYTIPATQGAAVALQEDDTIEIFTYDRWFDVHRYIARARKISGSKILFDFNGSEMTMSVGEERQLDLDKDDQYELRMKLDSISGRIAYMTFTRDTEIAVEPPKDEKPAVTEAPEGKAEPAEESIGLTRLHILLLLIALDLIFVLYIEIRRRNGKV